MDISSIGLVDSPPQLSSPERLTENTRIGLVSSTPGKHQTQERQISEPVPANLLRSENVTPMQTQRQIKMQSPMR